SVKISFLKNGKFGDLCHIVKTDSPKLLPKTFPMAFSAVNRHRRCALSCQAGNRLYCRPRYFCYVGWELCRHSRF
ncbi:hypothetical protein, partial [Escherichia coli]|uniref:hypothetical protein n=1 Tax=Escherichia coli TaxID=562 RepID=UPI00227E5F2F